MKFILHILVLALHLLGVATSSDPVILSPPNIAMILGGDPFLSFWSHVSDGAQIAAQSVGVNVQISHCSSATAFNQAIMAACMNKSVAAVVLAPIFALENEASIAMVSSMKPLITINSGPNASMPSLGQLTHIGPNNTAAGAGTALYFNSLELKCLLCVIIDNHTDSSANYGFTERCNAAKSAFKGTTKQITINSTASLVSLLESDSYSTCTVDALYVTSGISTLIDPVAALQQANLNHVKVILHDLNDLSVSYLVGGNISSIIDQQPWSQGYLPISLLNINIRYNQFKNDFDYVLNPHILTGPIFYDTASIGAQLPYRGVTW